MKGVTLRVTDGVLGSLLAEMQEHLDGGLIPFWHACAVDTVHGGYLTHFDEEGCSLGTTEKYLNTQARLVWWFSTLARRRPGGGDWIALARHGYHFITRHFRDEKHGGWFWKVRADGGLLDDGKVVYGQSFAIYALAEYFLATGDQDALRLARETFDLVVVHCADTHRGGFLENLERDWSPSAPGYHAGDRKSLDTHMHLLESFTQLYAASGCEVHRRRMLEVAGLIVERMIDPTSGAGRNQFDLAWRPIPALSIRRTWNAERHGERPAAPVDTTSYGHNLELVWLLRRALETARAELTPFLPAMRGVLDHAMAHGIDWEHGGVFRDGAPTGGPIVLEKEFWQNAEALVGLLDGFETFNDRRYLDALLNVWRFARDRFVAPCGEWRVLLDRSGRPLDPHVGNDWKVSYHTGRAMLECVERLTRLSGGAE